MGDIKCHGNEKNVNREKRNENSFETKKIEINEKSLFRFEERF